MELGILGVATNIGLLSALHFCVTAAEHESRWTIHAGGLYRYVRHTEPEIMELWYDPFIYQPTRHLYHHELSYQLEDHWMLVDFGSSGDTYACLEELFARRHISCAGSDSLLRVRTVLLGISAWCLALSCLRIRLTGGWCS
ncbi:hypothetical protein QBC35DRAFT_509960 [Podospora australis]|uniref:Uncharacterized protein n=1 Tax=Podospora australis TaxID=1536484 RepID=A0AAN7ACS9_9PEZI|nr:hypothetical protein QBC35DRAFT_509960 [Podospora australis]